MNTKEICVALLNLLTSENSFGKTTIIFQSLLITCVNNSNSVYVSHLSPSSLHTFNVIASKTTIVVIRFRRLRVVNALAIWFGAPGNEYNEELRRRNAHMTVGKNAFEVLRCREHIRLPVNGEDSWKFLIGIA